MLRDEPGNAKRRAPREGRGPVRYIDLRASSGRFGSVAGQCKVLQGMGRVVAEGDAAKVVQVRIMAAEPGLIGVGDAHDLPALSVSKLSGAR